MECWIWDWIEMNRMNYKEMGWIGLDGIGWGWIERIIKELDELLRNGMECLIWDRIGIYRMNIKGIGWSV